MERASTNIPTSFAAHIWKVPAKFRPRVAFLPQVWKRHRKSPVHRVLDIACGDSPHGRLLVGDGFQVVGIDRSRTMIASGRAKARDLKHLRFYRRANRKVPHP